MVEDLDNNEFFSKNPIDNRYVVRKILGEGAIGRTYLAIDAHRFNELCVLKEFAPSGTGKIHLQKSQELFKQEAKILLQIQHPQIPKLLACFEWQKKLFLVQEYIHGKTYSQLLQERQQQGKAFVEAEVIRLAIELLPVLKYIHDRNIVHRDISPDNIIQPIDRPPVLIDFGVGKLMVFADEEESLKSISPKSLTGTMSFVGKIGYAPYEQISMGVCSPKSDLYALGVTSIVLLTGKQPAILIDRSSLEWQWRLYTDVSDDFANIINKLLAYQPKNRYQSSQELFNDLQKLIPSQKTIVYLEESPPIQEFILPTTEFSLADPSAEYGNFPTELQQPEINLSSFSIEELSSIEPPFEEPRSPRLQEDRAFLKERKSPYEGKPHQPAPLQSQPQQPINQELDSNPDLTIPIGQPHLSSHRLDPKFLEDLQDKLAYYIGPMAILVLEEELDRVPTPSPQELVKMLAQEIPDYQQAQEFIAYFN
jgi:serine/threonine protein kinase